MSTATAEKQPARERDILIPGNWRLAVRAKRSARLVNREVEWQAIDADVKKRSNHRAHNEGERAEDQFVSRSVHVLRCSMSILRGVPSPTRSRCSRSEEHTSELQS